MTQEIWKNIEDAPNYMISNFGKVKNIKTGRILKNSVDKYGYLKVSLMQGNKMLQKRVHRLVAKAFVNGEAPDLIVNHKDGNKLNPHFLNLEWITHAENMAHAVEKGLIRKLRRWEVTKSGKMKLVERG